MAIKLYKPTTPGRRGMTTQDMSEITTKKPVKSLLVIKKKHSGRNNQGRITTRHRGGGTRNYYRLINFKLPVGTSATIEAIEYDPNRSARIARIKDINLHERIIQTLQKIEARKLKPKEYKELV